jgi:hypothetical protein
MTCEGACDGAWAGACAGADRTVTDSNASEATASNSDDLRMSDDPS